MNRLYLFFFFTLFYTVHTVAQGVLLSEYRMFLSGSSIRTLQVCNPTEESRTFELSFVNKQMDEDGRIVEIPDSVIPPYSIRKELRVFPKVITLAPNECQEVQIQLKNNQQLPDGEFRSYLQLFPRVTPVLVDTTSAQEGFKSGIVIRIGVAIPIMYRKNCEAGIPVIDSVKADRREDKSVLSFDIQRQGCGSVFGDIVVTGKKDGKPVILVEQPGCAVYANMPRRIFEIKLPMIDLDKDQNNECAVTISFTDREKVSGKKEPVSETVFLPAALFENAN